MCKRIVGLLAVVAILGVVFACSNPKKGTLEWHKKQYLRTSNRLCKGDWRSRLADWVSATAKVTPEFLYPNEREEALLEDEVGCHRKALVSLGFLSERWVVVTNRHAPRQGTILKRPTAGEEEESFVDIICSDFGGETTTLLVIAPSQNIRQWEEYVRDSGKYPRCW